jgi:hypothetical protein
MSTEQEKENSEQSTLTTEKNPTAERRDESERLDVERANKPLAPSSSSSSIPFFENDESNKRDDGKANFEGGPQEEDSAKAVDDEHNWSAPIKRDIQQDEKSSFPQGTTFVDKQGGYTGSGNFYSYNRRGGFGGSFNRGYSNRRFGTNRRYDDYKQQRGEGDNRSSSFRKRDFSFTKSGSQHSDFSRSPKRIRRSHSPLHDNGSYLNYNRPNYNKNRERGDYASETYGDHQRSKSPSRFSGGSYDHQEPSEFHRSSFVDSRGSGVQQQYNARDNRSTDMYANRSYEGSRDNKETNYPRDNESRWSSNFDSHKTGRDNYQTKGRVWNDRDKFSNRDNYHFSGVDSNFQGRQQDAPRWKQYRDHGYNRVRSGSYDRRFPLSYSRDSVGVGVGASVGAGVKHREAGMYNQDQSRNRTFGEYGSKDSYGQRGTARYGYEQQYGDARYDNFSSSTTHGYNEHMKASSAALAPPSSDVLPPDWVQHTTNDGKKYYYNKVTKQSQWEKPM